MNSKARVRTNLLLAHILTNSTVTAILFQQFNLLNEPVAIRANKYEKTPHIMIPRPTHL